MSVGVGPGTVLKPPTPIAVVRRPAVFLAGSIEMGAAEDWQATCADRLARGGWTVLNPRRDDWNRDWPQEPDFGPFREQVEWELHGLAISDVTVLHFEPGTKSPITLLELGLYADSGTLLVSCPPGYWRRGNVQIVCEQYAVPCFDNLDSALTHLEQDWAYSDA